MKIVLWLVIIGVAMQQNDLNVIQRNKKNPLKILICCVCAWHGYLV